MPAEYTSYSAPGWGVGELWTGDDLVLAHEFRFQPVSDTERRALPATAESSSHVGDGATPRRAQNAARSGWGRIGTDLALLSPSASLCLTPGELVARFEAFFAGEDVRFDDVALDLDGSTPFQRAVATALRKVPRGEVVSYGELAALAGYPGAARAVGTFCAGNRFMLLVPCHRVVGASGIGGYGSAGVGVKRRLLALEGVEL